MIKPLSYILLAFMACVSLPAAAEDMPFQYMRDTVTIARQPAIHFPWQAQEDAQPQPPLPMTVEIRDAVALLGQKDWFSLTPPKVNEGILLVYDTPTVANIERANHYAPLDVLLIGQQGVIHTIVPSVRLSSLQAPLQSQEKLKAIMLLKDGASDALKIRPGDEVVHSLFTTQTWSEPKEKLAIQQPKPMSEVLILQDAPRATASAVGEVNAENIKKKD